MMGSKMKELHIAISAHGYVATQEPTIFCSINSIYFISK